MRHRSVPRYGRVLLKLSGEALVGTSGTGNKGLTWEALEYTREELRRVHQLGVELAVVVGGGNLLRGREIEHLDRAIADHMGILITNINGLALHNVLRQSGIPAVLQSAIPTPGADPVDVHRAREALESRHIVIFAGGTGKPYVTTDTAAAMRAAEIHADVMVKATQVEGVYTSDPRKDLKARLLKELSYRQAIREELGFMDLKAISMCEASDIPIIVFNFFQEGNLKRVVGGEEVGTAISSSG